MISISQAGIIQDFNGAMVLATGLSPHALIGQEFASHYSDQIRARQGVEQVFRDGMIQNYELA